MGYVGVEGWKGWNGFTPPESSSRKKKFPESDSEFDPYSDSDSDDQAQERRSKHKSDINQQAHTATALLSSASQPIKKTKVTTVIRESGSPIIPEITIPISTPPITPSTIVPATTPTLLYADAWGKHVAEQFEKMVRVCVKHGIHVESLLPSKWK
ncbi:hypothetical protein L1987_27664 [Smallanthus sonchifolius]|uniref:Uncharacterized protein n=1 Tax=Smallanthus sonchifolius TaxID=185202 RepID=A0ACB9IBL9_9ASTR|nr:hypothetical protein L1987_27664 [Smallanthus sonchifolius]